MIKTTNKLLLFVLLLSVLTIIACQKQDTVEPSPIQKTNSVITSLARTDNKNYRIPLDTAATRTAAWRQKNEASFSNGIPNSFTISIESLQQLLTEATTNHAKLSGVRVYLNSLNGKINIITVPIGMDNADILHYDGDVNTIYSSIYQPAIDAPCPPTCLLVPNILNTSK